MSRTDARAVQFDVFAYYLRYFLNIAGPALLILLTPLNKPEAEIGHYHR